jgi:hypothetical protein
MRTAPSVNAGRRFGPIAPSQKSRSVAQHDQPARQLGNPAAVDRSSNLRRYFDLCDGLEYPVIARTVFEVMVEARGTHADMADARRQTC